MALRKIRPHGVLKVTDSGTTHVPKLIRKEIDRNEIAFLVFPKGALLFDPQIEVDMLVKALSNLIDEVMLRARGLKNE